jgi:hypothetical protein
MFNLPAFIRQLLPPLRRVPVLGKLIEVLFGGVPANQTDLEQTGKDAVDSIATTGQTAVLTALLNKSVEGLTGGVIYIAEALSANTDFQVVVPPDLSDAGIELVRALVFKYKLTGKRFAIVRGADYSVVDNSGPIGFAFVPYIRVGDNYLRYALDKNTTQRVVIRSGDQVLLDQTEIFLGASDEHAFLVDPSRSYVLTIGTISYPVVPIAESVSDVAGYRWSVANGRTLFVGVNLRLSIPDTYPSMRVDGPNGVVFSNSITEFRANLAGVDFQFLKGFDNLPYGVYTVLARAGSASRKWYVVLSANNSGDGQLILGDPPSNQAPTSIPIDNQTATEGTAYRQVIPANTFTDVDGVITTRNVAGLPPGLSYAVNTNGDIVISGTPTGAATANVTVTATDNGGLSVSDQFTLTVAAKPTIVVPTTPVAGSNTYSGQNVSEAGSTNPNIMNLSFSVDADGMVAVKEGATGDVDGQRWYLLPFRDGGGQGETGSYYTKEQMEADRFPQGRYMVFICLVMQGTPADDKHRDGPYHAEQRAMFI